MKPTTAQVRERAMDITTVDQFGAIVEFGATVKILAAEMGISAARANAAVAWAARRQRNAQMAADGTGDFLLRVRLTENQRIRLQVMADRETGGNMSEFVRRAVFA
jgi:hypothetical protein